MTVAHVMAEITLSVAQAGCFMQYTATRNLLPKRERKVLLYRRYWCVSWVYAAVIVDAHAGITDGAFLHLAAGVVSALLWRKHRGEPLYATGAHEKIVQPGDR